MSQEQTGTLLQVFPVLLLAAVLEGTRVHQKIRRLKWYRWLVLTELSAGLAGMVLCYIGVTGSRGEAPVGLHSAVTTVIQLSFYVLAFGLVVQLMAIVATQENADDEGAAEATGGITREEALRRQEDAALLRVLTATPKVKRRRVRRLRRSSTE
ncbi:hypothetical protein [Curtobacterium flaccumfaciens]|uniref:hypothetical protein n=1 Tax=Curtobacterium flaccumfaciens TaxID=2035 RepID=UPI001BDF7297|nr:hypothetical protein [Curtobacterium flaccumfaciens]MBT1582573.1 hypothetical protein [Curtobacterium flaccumfaciens pv. flaccumfaciens]MCX2796814.1 hypothetical protein [Curtobacterium flaccumfaciens pv. flaccumfaciens]